MTQIDKSKPVLVTGATGYVAGWLVKQLLEAGITVHAAVRNRAACMPHSITFTPTRHFSGRISPLLAIRFSMVEGLALN